MKCLIVIDVQNDFIDGVFKNEEAKKILPNIKDAIKVYKEAGYEVIFTQDTHYENDYNDSQCKKVEMINLPKHCIAGTWGWKIPKEIDDLSCKYIIKNNFGYNWWWLYNKDIESITLIGLCTDICVITNALLLRTLYPDVPISVDAACCAGSVPERHKAALEIMKSCLIEVLNDD